MNEREVSMEPVEVKPLRVEKVLRYKKNKRTHVASVLGLFLKQKQKRKQKRTPTKFNQLVFPPVGQKGDIIVMCLSGDKRSMFPVQLIILVSRNVSLCRRRGFALRVTAPPPSAQLSTNQRRGKPLVVKTFGGIKRAVNRRVFHFIRWDCSFKLHNYIYFHQICLFQRFCSGV